MDRPHRPHPVGTTRSPLWMPKASVGRRPTIEPELRSRTSCLVPLVGRVGGDQLLGIEAESEQEREGEEKRLFRSLVSPHPKLGGVPS